MNVTHIKFKDKALVTEVRGYDHVDISNPGVIAFVWVKTEEVLIYPFRDIQYVSSSIEGF